MVRVENSTSYMFRVEELEGRCLMAGLPWPIDAAEILSIAATYGQFDNRLPNVEGKIHFHGGIDIEVAKGKTTFVKAIEAGVVVRRQNRADPNGLLSIASDAGNGWNYLHVLPLVDLNTRVEQGDRIGIVQAFPAGVNGPTHLHLEAASGNDISNPDSLRPNADPLDLLDPAVIADTTPPTVGDIHFMRGEDDNTIPHRLTGGSKTTPESEYKINQDEAFRREEHGYFESQDYSKAWAVGQLPKATRAAPAPTEVDGTSNIEIIANAFDRVKGTWEVGVKSIEFSATGKFAAKTIPTVRPFNFAGVFTSNPNRPGVQDYDSLTISDLTRVAYENDFKSPSNAARSVGPIGYFHVLTNTDAKNTIVEIADRTRYWRSKVVDGAAWNDLTAAEAANNARGAYPDDYYTVTVTARDAAGNSTSDSNTRVLLDNWAQVITVERIAPGGVMYTIKGRHFLGNAQVPIYGLTDNVLFDGAILANVGTLLGTAATDADGKFTIDLAVADKYKLLVADYGYPNNGGGSGIYEFRLDAVSPRTTTETRPGGDISPAGPESPAGGLSPKRTGPTVPPAYGFALDGGLLVVTGPDARPARPVAQTLRAPAAEAYGPVVTRVQVADPRSDIVSLALDGEADPLDLFARVEPGRG